MVPLDRLLIETDSPFLAPVPHRGKRNEPAHVVRVAEAIAELRGMTAEAIGEAARRQLRAAVQAVTQLCHGLAHSSLTLRARYGLIVALESHRAETLVRRPRADVRADS